MLWIALFLPELPLQLAQRGQAEETPLLIAEGPVTNPLVCCANAAAQERGVLPGMSVAAARTLAGELAVRQRDPDSEARALHNLACWAGQFTPNVALHDAGNAGLMLEVQATLRLHGGLPALLAGIRRGLAELGYRAAPGVAPTPLAAWLLARAWQAGLRVRLCRDSTQLPERLAPLPLALLDWPADLLQTLQALGIDRIGPCLALPRDGFIRRFGATRRLDLDRALGLVPDPRAWFEPPASFASRLEFGFELNDAVALLFPLKRLLQELEGFLRSRGAGVQQWQLLLEHVNRGRTTITLGTTTPQRSAEHLLALARERLVQSRLMAPVLALGIAAEQPVPCLEHSQSFMPDPRSRAIGWGQLLDRLTARLGSERLHRLRARDEYRPEQAWLRCAATVTDQAGAPRVSVPRPLWLLDPPRALSSRDDAPLCQGRLDLLAGPERIEAGWWDGQGVCRDYYVARNPQGETLWIYREHRRQAAWYLHGIFA